MISEEEITVMETYTSSDSMMIEVSDREHAFLSQLESCSYRGANFECSTPIEFDFIFDIEKYNDNEEEDDHQKKIKPRKSI